LATIEVRSEGRTFECALNFAIIDGKKIICASYAGQPSAVWAVSACAIEGRRMSVDYDGYYYDNLYADGKYKRIDRKIGNIWHGMFIHKNAVYYESCSMPIIIAVNEDIDAAIGKYIVSKFNVPSEWQDSYSKLLKKEYLNVLKDETTNVLGSVQAVRITGAKESGGYGGLSESHFLQCIEMGIKKGILKIPKTKISGCFDPSWTTRDYLKANAGILSKQVDQVKPRHDFNFNGKKLNPAIAQMDRIPFPIQAHAIQGIVNVLDHHENMAIVCGEMGTGKSIISLGVCNVLHKKNNNPNKGMSVLLSAPGMTIPKWESKEIRETLPDSKIFTIRSTNDAANYLKRVRKGYKPEGLEFVLVSIDRAKLGPDPWCVALWKEIHPGKIGSAMRRTYEYAWHCPSCMKPISEEKDDYIVYAGWNIFACGNPPSKPAKTLNGIPSDYLVKWKLPSKIKRCPNCGSPLWRPALKTRGETQNRPRWFVSLILKKLRKHFDLYVCDEVHQTKATDSGRGDAFAQMTKAGKKTLCLTGTLLNGMSTSIKEILWRTDPGSLIKEGFDRKSGMVAWARRYGVLEQVFHVSDEDDGIYTRRKRVDTQPREKPGISPELVANHMLHRTAYLELSDLELPLPKLHEIPMFIEMDEDHADEYANFHKKLERVCKEMYMKGNKGAYAKFIPSTINYADRPDMGAYVEINSKERGLLKVVDAPKFDADFYHAKERELVKIVKENLAENRGCIIYCNYTNHYSVHSRVKKILQDHGIDVKVLEANVSPDKRVEWLEQNRDKKVIVCNMRLVETGLDLLYWPTIIFYQLNYDINTVRQSSRRSWRIGQTRECRIYYLIYEGTQQFLQFEHCMKKRAHAMFAEGKIDRSELAEYGRDDKSALAFDLADCLSVSAEELKGKWITLADKDKELKEVEELDFLDEIKEIQEKLTQKTLTLCGIKEEEIEIEEPVAESNIFDLDAFIPRRKKRKPKAMPKGWEQPSLF